jgi:protein-tyrosine-phosphatase
VQRTVLFVCDGNTGRSAMAEAIGRMELATAPPGWEARSAGLAARSPGAPMADPAVRALRSIGIPPHPHRSRQLTWQMCRDSAAVYCMTRDQRAAIEQLAPEVRGRTFCLDPAQDIPDPAAAADAAAHTRVARILREQVPQRLREQVAAVPVQAQAGA